MLDSCHSLADNGLFTFFLFDKDVESNCFKLLFSFGWSRGIQRWAGEKLWLKRKSPVNSRDCLVRKIHIFPEVISMILLFPNCNYLRLQCFLYLSCIVCR